MDSNGLIELIGRELNIPIKSDDKWQCRVVYSIAGKMALASLWDYNESNEDVSIRHFKQRISQIIDAYSDLYPEVRFAFAGDRSAMCDDIYSIYARSGYMYHSPHRISPAAYKSAGNGSIILKRGVSPDEKICMSGLGLYSIMSGNVPDEENELSVKSMFGLQEDSFEKILEDCMGDSEWEEIKIPNDAEYIRLSPPFTRGYWKNKPDKDLISMVRYGSPVKHYAFYRLVDGRFQQKSIAEWRIRDYRSDRWDDLSGYRRIAIALLHKYNTLPVIYAKREGTIINVVPGYRLPPTEEDFYKLYSWPVGFNFDSGLSQSFKRNMSKEFYPVFKSELESIGYSFVEE